MFQDVLKYIREIFQSDGFIPLHEPRFIGNERKYVNDAIDSTFVSSVGRYVNQFEEMMCRITGAQHAVATVNGTAALQVALRLAGVQVNDEVITQAVTFVATANAIAYCGGRPVFVDVDRSTLGLSPEALEAFLGKYGVIDKDGHCLNRSTGQRIAACVPMHTFGHPCRIDEIVRTCSAYRIPVVEDAAESLGSYFKGKHTGTFGQLGIFSFNGNKTVTCGGGGAVVTNDEATGKRAKHVTTTAKVPHPYEYVHDEIGYNYRMPNLNAALACAQLELLPGFVRKKRELAQRYATFFTDLGIHFVTEPADGQSNYWLNALILKDLQERNDFLEASNAANIMTRPLWRLMNKLPMFSDCQTDGLANSQWLEERVVNIPSSVPLT